jgi:nucleotide-binding universal stress UspA family protein
LGKSPVLAHSFLVHNGEIALIRRTDWELIVTFKKILLAVDREPVAAHAAEVGVDLARKLGAEMAFVHVIDTTVDIGAETWATTELLGVAKLQGKNLLDDYRGRLSLKETALEFVVEGSPADEIVKAAREWPADIIVIGSHGRGGLQRALIGSVAEAVTRHAPCPVLVVRAKE